MAKTMADTHEVVRRQPPLPLKALLLSGQTLPREDTLLRK
jgi:hypothetical protein